MARRSLPASSSSPPIPGEDELDGWGLRLVGRSISIDSRVLFDFDKSVLKPAAAPVLEKVAIWFMAHEGAGVMEIAGHCDARGSHDYNDRLSLARARSVWRFLVEYGVPADRVVARGYGKRKPKMKAGSGPAERVHAVNRRVEFMVLGHGRSTQSVALGASVR